jgi:hypothetical protein
VEGGVDFGAVVGFEGVGAAFGEFGFGFGDGDVALEGIAAGLFGKGVFELAFAGGGVIEDEVAD